VHVCTKEEIFATKWLLGRDCSFTVHPHHSSTDLLDSTLSTYLMNDCLAPCYWYPAQHAGFHRRRGSAKLSNQILWHVWHLAKYSKEYTICRCYTGVRRIHCTHSKFAVVQILTICSYTAPSFYGVGITSLPHSLSCYLSLTSVCLLLLSHCFG